jgi:hypothetical protein
VLPGALQLQPYAVLTDHVMHAASGHGMVWWQACVHIQYSCNAPGGSMDMLHATGLQTLSMVGDVVMPWAARYARCAQRKHRNQHSPGPCCSLVAACTSVWWCTHLMMWHKVHARRQGGFIYWGLVYLTPLPPHL